MLTSAVDLNADLGEEVTDDDGLLGVVTSANVACGYHAGTPAVMRAVCAEAVRRGDDVLVIHRLIHICVEKPLLPVEHGTTSVDVPVGSAECCANPLRGGSAGA